MILVGIRRKDRRSISRTVAFGSPAARGERSAPIEADTRPPGTPGYRPDRIALHTDEMHGEIEGKP